MPRLIELPDGNWIAPKAVRGVTVLVDARHGARVRLDTTNAVNLLLIEFDDAEAARGWARAFAAQVNAAAPAFTQSQQ